MAIELKISLQLKKRKKMVANSNENSQRQEVRAANTLALIVGTFIVLWLPGIVSLFIIPITENRSFSQDYLELTIFLVHVNAAIDPLIYAYRMKNMRDGLRDLFKCYVRKKLISSNDSNTVSQET